MQELLVTTLTDLGVYFALVLVYTFIGAYQNINLWRMRWDWRKWVNGIAKYAVFGISLVATVLCSALLIEQADRQNVVISNIDAVAPNVITGVVLVASAIVLAKIVAKLSTSLGLSKEQLTALQKQAVQEREKPLVFDIENLPEAPEEYVALKACDERGLGRYYSVGIDTYDVFRANVLGKPFDIDGWYGAQCWDGCALLWQQKGLTLSTGGTGQARGCWTIQGARVNNAGSDFEMITDKRDIKRGDVVVFNSGRYGHIAFADEDYTGGSLKCLGQNQGGYNGAFNVVSVSLSSFLGAFRFKAWRTEQVKPAVKPAPKPAVKPTGKVPNTSKTEVVEDPVTNQRREVEVLSIDVGSSVYAQGRGTADAYGGGAKTKKFAKTKMKVIGKCNDRYALNQFNQGTVGNVADVTGWWSEQDVKPIN